MPDLHFYLAALPAVCLVGLSKGGFSGLVMIAMSLMATVTEPVTAAAILLPILIMQDGVTVWNFRKDYDRAALKVLLPAATAGILTGALAAAFISASGARLLIGVLAFSFALNNFLGLGARLSRLPFMAGPKAGLFWGWLSGLTSQISHAGGPPYQIWMLPQKLPRDIFVGTTAWYFAILNLIKLPFFIGLGALDREAFTIALTLLLPALGATVFGIWLVRRIPVERFYTLINGLMLLSGVKLCYDGFTGLVRGM